MSYSVTPQIQANLANLIRVYREEGTHVSVDVAMAELDEMFQGQPEARGAFRKWFNDAIEAYDIGAEAPECPIDPATRIPNDKLPEPKMGQSLQKVLDGAKLGRVSLPSGSRPSPSTLSPSPPPPAVAKVARKRLPTASSKRPPAQASKRPPARASKQPRTMAARSEHHTSSDESHESSDDESSDDEPLDNDKFDAGAHNPAMTLDPATGIRRGTRRSQPILADGTFTFWVERQIERDPSEASEFWPRTITNYQFVNDAGEMVSIAEGKPAEPLYLVGITGSITGQYESSHRLMAGYWEHDEISRERSPTEVLWVKARIGEITSGKQECFRLGRTLALCAWSDDAVYVLQSAATRYENRLRCSTVETKRFNDVPLHRSSKKPTFMDQETWDNLREDVARFKKAGLILAAPKPPPMSVALRKRLEAEGRMAQATWKLAIVDKQVHVWQQRYQKSKAPETPFQLDSARSARAKLQSTRAQAQADIKTFGETREPSYDDNDSEYREPVPSRKHRKRNAVSRRLSPVGPALNVSTHVDVSPPPSPMPTPAHSDTDAMGEPDSGPSGDQGNMDVDVPGSSAPSCAPPTPAGIPTAWFGSYQVAAGSNTGLHGRFDQA
ncbi:hypothetical protein FRC06_009123 [Ceratobasidium sp. 370]|nr:hypothetical protein FRC06_009123 [Ceratobasidium sp. 370]